MVKTVLAALGLGFLAGLGFAPLSWSILALAAYPCLYRLMFAPEAEAGKDLAIRAAILAFVFYFGNYIISLFWVVEAPAHADPSLTWVGFAFLFALPIALALFVVPVAFVAGWLRGHYFRMLVLIGGLAVAEFARGNLFSGLTWNMPSHLLLGSDVLLQNISWSGLYGGNLLTLLILILPASLFYNSKRAFVGASVSLAMIVCGFVYGWWRLAGDYPADESYGVRIVQANLQGEERWKRENLLDNYKLFLRMSEEDRPDWVKAVIWPETSVPFDFTKYPDWLLAATSMIPEGGMLVAGVVYRPAEGEAFQNGMFGIGKSGKTEFIYHKHHLVPFGEYVPLADYLPLPALAARDNHFAKGEPPSTIKADSIPNFIPLICYEIIFPYLRQNAYDGTAKFILNISNDEWYKPSITKIPIGYHQHFQLARFAAVEAGLPVIRATSSGISAVIDPEGRIRKSLPYNERGVIDSLIPRSQPSFALAHGNAIFLALLCILSLAITAIFLYSKNRTNKSE